MIVRLLLLAALLHVLPEPGAGQPARQGRGHQLLLPQGSGRTASPADTAGRVREAAPPAASALEARTLLDAVEEGLAAGDIARFSRSLASTMSLNLRGAESGTFSANQAHYVLQNYLRSRRLVGLSLTAMPEGESPYGSGTAALHGRGEREEVQVFVALRRAGDRLVITQITIH